jgi:hypothetical protein
MSVSTVTTVAVKTSLLGNNPYSWSCSSFAVPNLQPVIQHQQESLHSFSLELVLNGM